ncbi:hypothetical protein [Lactococcus lactis]|uniref:hypothetical protein n=1 Tax=Lactococcus lactis TaxID=1358 RepID=UPI0028916DF1|nr:hypothetical protein [Lactococcus lactis]MDT2852239.1 hypothetical protein [Lactococcus lactis]
MTKSNIPRLTGGILFCLFLEIIKPRTKKRVKNSFDIADGLSQTDIMKKLIELLSETKEHVDPSSFRKAVTRYKKCEISNGAYLPFDNISYITTFSKSVNNKNSALLINMADFIDKNLNENKLSWLVDALIETIVKDESIGEMEMFQVSYNQKRAKKDLLVCKYIEIEIFLLNILKFILNKRQDNTVGHDTFSAWYKQSGTGAQWKFSNIHLGSTVNNIEVIRYNESEQVSSDDESSSESESFAQKEEHRDSDEKQIFNNPKIINQNAVNIYNIEHVENLS